MKSEPRELARKTIEETINAMLYEEADQLVGADPYERTDARVAYRARHYERGFTTTSGQATLRMPKLKGMRFTTAVIERHKRRETSVEEAIIEMYLAGVSTRRIEDVSEALWGAGVSDGTPDSVNHQYPDLDLARFEALIHQSTAWQQTDPENRRKEFEVESKTDYGEASIIAHSNIVRPRLGLHFYEWTVISPQ